MKNPIIALLFLIAAGSVFAQESSSGSFFNQWLARSSATQAKQPGWAVPLVTTYTGLIQVARTDIVRQIAPTRTTTWNYDNSKGLNLVPWANTELAFNLPPYIQHNSTAKDGFGDVSFLGKYRIASGNAQHGSYKNGSTDASVAPTVGGGKGFGNFDLQSTLGATLPTGNPAITTAGRPVVWNTVAQYRFGKLFWPEVESNATFYKGGTNDGKTQEFITPGLIVGKCALHPSDPKSRLGMAFGAGMQIAASRFHSYNHGLVMSARWIF